MGRTFACTTCHGCALSWSACTANRTLWWTYGRPKQCCLSDFGSTNTLLSENPLGILRTHGAQGKHAPLLYWLAHFIFIWSPNTPTALPEVTQLVLVHLDEVNWLPSTLPISGGTRLAWKFCSLPPKQTRHMKVNIALSPMAILHFVLFVHWSSGYLSPTYSLVLFFAVFRVWNTLGRMHSHHFLLIIFLKKMRAR